LNAQNICGKSNSRGHRNPESAWHNHKVPLSDDSSPIHTSALVGMLFFIRLKRPSRPGAMLSAVVEHSWATNNVRPPRSRAYLNSVSKASARALCFGFCSRLIHFSFSAISSKKCCEGHLLRASSRHRLAKVSPVIQRASSDARKTTTPAISSGWARRFRACRPSRSHGPHLSWQNSDMSVATIPGATAFDSEMPRGPSANAKCFTSVSIAPLWPHKPKARRRQHALRSDETKTMLPPLARPGAIAAPRKTGRGH